jgi:hypothetical protein
MPVSYYSPSNDYPGIILAVVDRVKAWVWTTLYGDESWAVANNRIMLTNFEAGDEIAIRSSIERYKTSQGKFPFTAYNFGELTPVIEKRSHRQKSFSYYSSEYACRVSSQPSYFEIPMVSFFTTPTDYWRAYTKLRTDDSSLTRLTTPASVNGITTYFTIDLSFEINKGPLAYAFEDYLKFGNLYPLVHTVKVYFQNLVLITTSGNVNFPIYPVEDVIVSLEQWSPIDISLSINNATIHLAAPPTVWSTIPEEGGIEVDRDNSILINFSQPMDEESVEGYLSSDPFISADFSWNSSGTVLMITPTTSLESGTLYSILLAQEAESVYGSVFEEDFELTFTTGVN